MVVCDHEDLIRWSVAEHLRAEGFSVTVTRTGAECLAEVRREMPDVVLVDIGAPGSGPTFAAVLREGLVNVPVLAVGPVSALATLQEAVSYGATSYLTKPFDLRDVTFRVRQAVQNDRVASERKQLRARRGLVAGPFVNESPAVQTILDRLRALEGVEAPTMLLTGPPGAGHALVAAAIHSSGPRGDGPFVEVECDGSSDEIELRLFGREQEPAAKLPAMRGAFELARGGTVYLEGIEQLPQRMQERLRTVLEQRRFRRLRGASDFDLDAGVVLATTGDLEALVARGRFDAGLYRRFERSTVDLPRLADRREDIRPLVEHFLEQAQKLLGTSAARISDEAMALLEAYSWPGNVRDLRNTIERMATLNPSAFELGVEHLPSEVREGPDGNLVITAGAAPTFRLPSSGIDISEVERSFLVQALEQSRGNQTAAAKLLGITRYALRYRMEKFGLREATA